MFYGLVQKSPRRHVGHERNKIALLRKDGRYILGKMLAFFRTGVIAQHFEGEHADNVFMLRSRFLRTYYAAAQIGYAERHFFIWKCDQADSTTVLFSLQHPRKFQQGSYA